jgi:ribose 5-phosphate isomerase A
VRTAERARELGIPLTELDDAPELDLALDGADEVAEGSLALIKGLGGALLREKIVVEAAARFVVVADDSKIVARLGQHAPLPVEVAVFAHPATARRLDALALRPVLRMAGEAPYKTDNGNVIYDCHGIGGIDDIPALERAIVAIAGVVETGLFLDRAEQAIIGTNDGVRIMRRTA